MRLINKEKLIKTLVNDLLDFKGIVGLLYPQEVINVISYRVKEVYNLNYTMTTETQFFLIDYITSYIEEEINLIEFRKKIKELLK